MNVKDMNMGMEEITKTICAIAGGIASFLFGGWSQGLYTLVIFASIDYITGVIASGYHGKLSSRTGAVGIAKKVCMFLIIAVAHLVDQLLGDQHILRDGTIMFYVANEGISILENAGRMGLAVPSFIRQAVEILRGNEEDKARRSLAKDKANDGGKKSA